MTGFGVGDAPLSGGKIVAEIRSTNQRFLDVRARLPREMADLCLFAEQVARERLRRGRVEILVHAEGSILSARVLDKDRARAAFHAFAELRDELAPGSEIPLSLLASVPDLFAPPEGTELAPLRAAMKLAIERGLSAMEAMCRREGDALAADLSARCGVLSVVLGDLAAAVGTSREASRVRVRDRVDRLLVALEAPREDASIELGGTPKPPPRAIPPLIDRARVEAEIVLLSERADVAEELTRLGSHRDQLAEVICARGGEPIGRRLDFLLQEMLREANTLGAKAQDAALAQGVVALKVELERLREQVQNIE